MEGLRPVVHKKRHKIIFLMFNDNVFMENIYLFNTFIKIYDILSWGDCGHQKVSSQCATGPVALAGQQGDVSVSVSFSFIRLNYQFIDCCQGV